MTHFINIRCRTHIRFCAYNSTISKLTHATRFVISTHSMVNIDSEIPSVIRQDEFCQKRKISVIINAEYDVHTQIQRLIYSIFKQFILVLPVQNQSGNFS
jgi:hypothetical protein